MHAIVALSLLAVETRWSMEQDNGDGEVCRRYRALTAPAMELRSAAGTGTISAVGLPATGYGPRFGWRYGVTGVHLGSVLQLCLQGLFVLVEHQSLFHVLAHGDPLRNILHCILTMRNLCRGVFNL